MNRLHPTVEPRGGENGADSLPSSWARWGLLLILIAYLLIASLYALRTPLWQVPDEPAHVNYALYVARSGRLPILQPGDYDADYLERIKAAHFPPDMSVANIRYESHQPPLYYLGAALLIHLLVPSTLRATASPALAPAVYTMRLYSVLLSLGLLLAAYAIMRRLFPEAPSLALAAVAFIAFIPQHIAMMAGANNDALAELVLALVLLRLVADLKGGTQGWPSSARRGILLGIALLSKTTIYLPMLLAWATFHAIASRKGAIVRRVIAEGGVALLLASPFYVRNLVVYGWPDFLGLRRHAQIVVGQTTTAEFVAREGWAALWQRALTWTFRSFWGQFGWMGVLMDARVYKALAYFSLVLLAGAAMFAITVARGRRDSARRGLATLAAAATGTVLSYIGYNFSFLQHQGRYLFPMLIPLAAFIIPGVWDLLAPPRARWAALSALLLAAATLAAAIFDVGPFDRWDTLALLGLAIWFLLARRYPRLRPLWLILPFVVLGGMALLALYRFILPALA